MTDTSTLQEELDSLKAQLDMTHTLECGTVAGVQAKYRAISRLELEIAKVRARMEMGDE